MWNDTYLRFADKDAFTEAFEALAEGWDEDGAVDDIGLLFHDETGVASAGYHVNVRLPEGKALPAELLPFAVGVPVQPKRAFMA